MSILTSDREKQCAMALIIGIADSVTILNQEDNPMPNPISKNPFWSGARFYEQYQMEKLLDIPLSGEEANLIAKQWAQNGGNNTSSDGYVYAMRLIKAIAESPTKSYTPFDTGNRSYSAKEISALHGLKFWDATKDGSDASERAGSEALAWAFKWYLNELIENGTQAAALSALDATRDYFIVNGAPDKKTVLDFESRIREMEQAAEQAPVVEEVPQQKPVRQPRTKKLVENAERNTISQ